MSSLFLAAVAAGGIVCGPPPSEPSAAGVGPGPREYVVHRAAAAPTVDGSLDDAAWRDAPWTDPFVDIVGGDRPAPRLLTHAKLLWDDGYLYIGAELEEPDVWATLRQADDTVWHDDDFEVFLDPDGDGLAYYEMEINALGTVLDLFLPRPYNQGGHADLSWEMQGMRRATALHGTLNDPADRDGGWSVELAIPWAALRPPPAAAAGPGEAGRAPRPGDTWRVNFSRVEWPVDIVDGAYRKAAPSPLTRHPEDNWVWSPQGAVNMHLPSMWGRVRFEGAVPAPQPQSRP